MLMGNRRRRRRRRLMMTMMMRPARRYRFSTIPHSENKDGCWAIYASSILCDGDLYIIVLIL